MQRTPKEISAEINRQAQGKFTVLRQGYHQSSRNLCWFLLSNLRTVYFTPHDSNKTIREGLLNSGGL